MATGFLHGIRPPEVAADLAALEAALPAAANARRIVWTADGNLWASDGTTWQPLIGGGGGDSDWIAWRNNGRLH